MPKTKRLQTNFTKGEYSDLIEGRPDLAAYYNGARTLENVLIYPEGGVLRRPGTRFVVETKDSTKKSMLIPFEFNIEQAYILEYGNLYARFFKNGARIESGGSPVEVVTPYLEADLKDIHYRQSADVLFKTHPSYEIRKLNRISDTNWTVTQFNANPPPSFEADEDISEGTVTLTPSATTGTGITFTASAAKFLLADNGRQIIFGASRAVITAVDVGLAQVTADILDDFPDTNAIPAGSWFLRGSPQTTLNPDKKEPVGAQVTLTAGAAAFRDTPSNSVIGRFIKIYGGLIKVTVFTNASSIKGTILSVLSEATQADPAAAAAGSWSQEVASWSDARGWPQTLEFHQGRLAVGGTSTQKTTWWMSSSLSLSDFAIGTLATNAVEYTIAARKVNIIEWLISLGQLFIGDAENEHVAKGQGVDAPLGGDEIPFVQDQSAIGSQHIQPIVVQNAIIFHQRFKRKIFELSFNLEADSFSPKNRTLFSRQIGEGMFAQHAAAYAAEPNRIAYFVMENGQLGCLTFNREEEVIAWSRIVTDGLIESVAVIPHPDLDRHQVWIIVNRTINGATKRYVEYFEDKASEMSGRLWQELHTDSAKVGTINAGVTEISGLDHLEAKSVDVILGNSYIGQLTVTAGKVTIPGAQVPSVNTTYEVGLHYDSKIQTARVAIPNEPTEGLKRHWITAAVRFKDTIGGKINGVMVKPPDSDLLNGLRFGNPTDWDFEGRLDVEQDQPYPFQVLNIAGEVEFADQMG